MGGTDLFNPAALFITFRETIEAVIILTVLFGFLDKAKQPHLKPSVRWGVATGIIAALAVGAAFIILFYEAKTNLFEGENEYIFEGSVMIIATFFISSLAFSMLRMFQLQIKWENRLKEAAEAAAAKAAAGCKDVDAVVENEKSIVDPRWTFFLLAFTAVFREGVETFVFMAGVAQAEPKSLPIPGIVGVIIGIICGWFLFRGAKPASLAIFFYLSTFMLFLIAAGLFSRGMHEFQEMGKFGQYWEYEMEEGGGGGGRRHLLALPGAGSSTSLSPTSPLGSEPDVYRFVHGGFGSRRRGLMGDDRSAKVVAAEEEEDVLDEIMEGAHTDEFSEEDEEVKPVSWANTPLADWRGCCDDSSDEFYMLLRAIFGYSSVPTRLETVTYCGYWLLMLLIVIVKLKRGTLYGKILKKHNEEKEGAAAAALEAAPEKDAEAGLYADHVELDARTDDSAGSIEASRPHAVKVEGLPPAVAAEEEGREEPPAAAPAGPAARLASAALRALRRVGRVLSQPETQRRLVEGAVWLSIAGCVVGLLCASLIPGLGLREVEWEEGLPGSAPFPKLGVTRRFTLVVEEVEVNGARRIVVNGTSPGPELRVQHGNWVMVKVINKMQGRNTTMHWHGIVHRSSTFSDGVAGVTQCVIPGEGAEHNSVIYRFEAYHAGTFWYHGHVEGQYVDGLFGPLIVEGLPEQHGGKYNTEWTWMAADWYNRPAQDITKNLFLHRGNPDGFEPMPDAIAVNGKFSGDLRFSARRGDKVRVRFVNSASWSPWNVSVDGLSLTVIELDGQDVEPVTAPWLIVNVAQRVSFVIDTAKVHGAALRASNQLYFRVEALNDTYPLGFEGNYANQGYKKLNPLFLGVIDFAASEPSVAPQGKALPSYTLADVPDLSGEYEPLPPDQMSAANLPEADVEKPTHRMILALTMDNVTGLNLGYLNGATHSAANTVHQMPVLFRMVKFEEEYHGRPQANDVWKDDDDEDEELLEAWDIVPNKDGRNVIPFEAVVQLTILNYDGGPHPFHLHGHKLSLIASSDFPENEFTNGRNYLQRDVVTLPAASDDGTPGWVKVQFLADNPGVWALHCHIDWHMAAGLMTEIVEAPEKLVELTGDHVPHGQLELCGIEEEHEEDEDDDAGGGR